MFSRDQKARKAVEELHEDFLKLQREFKSLQMEWENAQDKLLTMMQRVAKRADVLQKEMDGGKPPLSPEEQEIARSLTPRQSRAQQMILERRRANGVLPPTG